MFVKDNDEFIGQYAVVCLVALAQGVLALSEIGIHYLYKDDFKMTPSQVSITVGIISLPWTFKPIYGMISDCYPLFGYRRKSYVMLFSFLAFICWYLLAFYVKNCLFGLVILFCIQLCTAFCNVIGEALLVEISQLRSKKHKFNEVDQQSEAGRNVSLFFGVKSCGTILTAYLGGYLLQKTDKHNIFAITGLVPLALCICSCFMGGENEISSRQSRLSNQNSSKEEKMNLFMNFLKKEEIYKPIIFILLFMITPTSSSSMFFFYTNELKFEPSFLGSLKFLHASGSLLGVLIYNKYLKQVKFKSQFIGSTFLCSIIGLSQLLLVTRYNQKLGLPDKLFCLGDTIIINIVGELNMLPILILACRLCPKSIEATMYAMLMSTISFGSMIASQLGAISTYLLGITQNNFDNLWIQIIISSVSNFLPLFAIHLINFQENVAMEQEITDVLVKKDESTLSQQSDELSSTISTDDISNDQQEMKTLWDSSLNKQEGYGTVDSQ